MKKTLSLSICSLFVLFCFSQDTHPKNGEYEYSYSKQGVMCYSIRTYKDDKIEGEVRDYYKVYKLNENDRLKMVCYYKNGNLEGELKEYYYNGQLKEIIHYKDGKVEGESKKYYDMGQLKQIQYYKNGKRDGEYKMYYENGQLKQNGYYIGEKLDGGVKKYDENGQLNETIYYKDGEIVLPTPTSPPSTNEVKIGKQIWMTKNLDVDKFRNGDIIPEAKTEKEWEKAGVEGKPAWCFYNNDAAVGKKYGKLYNWYAVHDKRGLAPNGWHEPSDGEWTQLIDYLGGKDVAGNKMKSTTGWSNDSNGTNQSGFSGFQYSFRSSSGMFGMFVEARPNGKEDKVIKGNTIDLGISFNFEQSLWWSATGSNESNAFCYVLLGGIASIHRSEVSKRAGYSIRCIKK